MKGSAWNREFGAKEKKDVRLPKALLEKIKEQIKKGRFASRSEFIREACWQLVDKLEEPEKDEEENSTDDNEETEIKEAVLQNLVNEFVDTAKQLIGETI